MSQLCIFTFLLDKFCLRVFQITLVYVPFVLCFFPSLSDHVAVIDEIQMLRDEDRGWAWTRALLGVPADEVHLCGEPAAIKIVEKILQDTQDDLTVSPGYHRC